MARTFDIDQSRLVASPQGKPGDMSPDRSGNATIWISVTASVCYAFTYFWRYPLFMLPSEIMDAHAATIFGRDLSLQECLNMAYVVGFGAAKLPAMRLQTSAFFFQHRLMLLLWMLFLSMVLTSLTALLRSHFLQVCALFGSAFLSSFLYGGIVTYLEGRRSTEILLASISASLVFAGTLSRASAAWMLHQGVSPRYMPLLLGAGAFIISAFLLVLTARAPPPNRADVVARSARTPMSPRKQWEFVRDNLFGVIATIGIWACISGLRFFRDFYTVKIFSAALHGTPTAKVYVLADVPGAVLSFVFLVMMSWVQNSQRALFLMLFINVCGLAIMAGSTWLFRGGEMDGMDWILLYSAGFYTAYSVLNAPLNERIFAVTRAEGTCSFLIYASDFFGYVATIALLMYQSFGPLTGTSNQVVLDLFVYMLYVLTAIMMFLAAASICYFARGKYRRALSHAAAA